MLTPTESGNVSSGSLKEREYRECLLSLTQMSQISIHCPSRMCRPRQTRFQHARWPLSDPFRQSNSLPRGFPFLWQIRIAFSSISVCARLTRALPASGRANGQTLKNFCDSLSPLILLHKLPYFQPSARSQKLACDALRFTNHRTVDKCSSF